MSFEVLAFLFLLAMYLGLELIQKVPATLHTPLMSGSNAISGITLIASMVLAAESTSWFGLVLAGFGVALATINVVGGYCVTDRMLQMFKSRDVKSGAAKQAEQR